MGKIDINFRHIGLVLACSTEQRSELPICVHSNRLPMITNNYNTIIELTLASDGAIIISSFQLCFLNYLSGAFPRRLYIAYSSN